MLTTPITEQAKQQEWNTICTIARNNVFPLQNCLQFKEQTEAQNTNKENTLTHTQRKKWGTVTYHSPLTQSYQLVQKY